MSTALPVVDANVFVRHIRQVHPDHSLRASGYIAAIESGEMTARSNELVL